MSEATAPSPIPEGPASRVLQAADRLFYTQGYGATGVNQLIEEAGVAKASFYLHFPSKTDLIVAYLRHRHDGWLGGLNATLGAHEEPAARLLAVFDFVAEWLQANEFRGCAFLNTIPEFSDVDSRPRQIVREHKQQVRESLAVLCAAVGRPEISDQVFLLTEGAVMQAAVTHDLWPVTAARQVVEGLLDRTARPSSTS